MDVRPYISLTSSIMCHVAFEGSDSELRIHDGLHKMCQLQFELTSSTDWFP